MFDSQEYSLNPCRTKDKRNIRILKKIYGYHWKSDVAFFKGSELQNMVVELKVQFCREKL